MSNEKEELTIDEGTITVSSVYSQKYVSSLRKTLKFSLLIIAASSFRVTGMNKGIAIVYGTYSVSCKRFLNLFLADILCISSYSDW